MSPFSPKCSIFSLPESSSKSHSTFNCCLLVSSGLWQLLSLSGLSWQWLVDTVLLLVLRLHMIKSDMVGTDTIRECPVFSFCILNDAKVELLAKAAAEVFLCAFQLHHSWNLPDVNMSYRRVNLDHLVKMIYSVFLPLQSYLFSSVSTGLYILGQVLLARANIVFVLTFCPTDFILSQWIFACISCHCKVCLLVVLYFSCSLHI